MPSSPRPRPRRRLATDDRGAVAVLAALFMVVFMVMLAFVVDIGTLQVTRTKLQDAVDAAALAAAPQLPAACAGTPPSSGSSACVTAGSYAVSNGVPLASVTVTSAAGSSSIRVSASQNVRLVFAPIIGQNSRTVTATAVATRATVASGAYGIYSANEWRVDGGGTGLSVSGAPAYAGSLNFNGNANNKLFNDPGGLQSPNTSGTNRWTDSTGAARTAPNLTTDQGTAYQYAMSIGLDGPSGGSQVIPAFGTPAAPRWAQIATGDCTINQGVLTANATAEVLYCGGTATVSGIPGAATRMVRAASITIAGDIGWNGTACPASSILLFATTGGVTSSGGNDDLCGSIYAPLGQYRTNGGGLDVRGGRIIADSIRLSGNGGTNVNTAGDTILSTEQVRLTE